MATWRIMIKAIQFQKPVIRWNQSNIFLKNQYQSNKREHPRINLNQNLAAQYQNLFLVKLAFLNPNKKIINTNDPILNQYHIPNQERVRAHTGKWVLLICQSIMENQNKIPENLRKRKTADPGTILQHLSTPPSCYLSNSIESAARRNIFDTIKFIIKRASIFKICLSVVIIEFINTQYEQQYFGYYCLWYGVHPNYRKLNLVTSS